MQDHPVDTSLRAATRFAVELLAWITGTWAAGQSSLLLGAAALVVLVGLPAVFNVPGDKNITGVPVPGKVRVVIELGLYVVALAAPWPVLGPLLAATLTLGVVIAALIQVPRWQWLAAR